MSPTTGKVLRAKLLERRGLLVPGAANALAARIIEDLGFEAVYLSGAGLTNSLLGMPDLGFISLPEIAQHTAALRESVSISIIVDADTGFGNALNVRHCVSMLEGAGADAIQLEVAARPGSLLLRQNYLKFSDPMYVNAGTPSYAGGRCPPPSVHQCRCGNTCWESRRS